MVLAANNVTDSKVDVVGTRGKVVRRHAVGTEEREVFDVVRGFDLLAVDGVIEADFFARATGNTEAEGEGLSGRSSPVAFVAGKLAHAGVEKPSLIGAVFLAVPGVGGGEVAVSQTLLKDGAGDLAVQGQAFGLFVFFIPTKIEPAQTLEDGVDGGVGVALDIRIIEPQHQGSSVATGVEPVENESASTADVQKTCRRRRESNAKHNF